MNKRQIEIKAQLKDEYDVSARWKADEIALKKNEVADLHARIRALEKEFKQVCDHTCVQGRRETNYYQDEYGSGVTDYHVRLYCIDCGQVLLDKMDSPYGGYHFSWQKQTEQLSLKQGCIWWDQQPGAYSSRNGKKIEDYGVRRIERTVIEYV